MTEPRDPAPTGPESSKSEPAPAPEPEGQTEAEADAAATDPAAPDPADRGGTGEPVGRDNIREGRVDGVMGGPHQQQGEGQGG